MGKKIKGSKNFSEFDYSLYSETEWRLKAACKTKKTSIFFY